MNSLCIATGNAKKFERISRTLAARCPNIALSRLSADIPELQTQDVRALLAKKVEHVRALTNLPFIVDDMTCVLEGTSGFPGTLTKDVLAGLGPKALHRLFEEGLKIEVRSTIALSVMDELHYFTGAVMGEIKYAPNRTVSERMPLDAIVFLAEQGKFLGDEGAVTHRDTAMSSLCDFLSRR